ncbi:hypothetical protein KFL_007270080 [Klebsormidium nitens]|uniref:FHA domain-containing protein n=1 Tax=Klebsormidium nitens TaxID=105231 RepID=A0A1Y1IPI2_KLENI|nr:hypothetical protein KFL_007270080 [Klebsormidium nitens]|eukprot:GAQ91101.1 hypothetical protein KFL_007270080 [Klebsormidium nitens]
MATPSEKKDDPLNDSFHLGADPPADTSAPTKPSPPLSASGGAASPQPRNVAFHHYQNVESPSPPPRCPSPVKTSISIGHMGPPAPRPGRTGSSSMPPPPPRQPSQDAGARKRAREGSPPLPGQGSPIPSYRRSISPPPRPGHASPHGSPLSIRRSSSPPLPQAGSPLRRPRSSSPPYENIIIIPQRQSSPIKIPRRSASPPLPGQGQGASAFKRPRSSSPSDAGFWHSGPFPGRPLASAPLRNRDVESSASQREYGAQRSGSSSSEDDRGKRLPPRDDADATSGVQPGVRGASSSSSDENAGSRSSGGEVADSSSSDKKRHEGSRASSSAHRGRPEAGPNRVGAMLPPPPRQPKRLSLPPVSVVEGAPGRAEASLSGESRVAHNSSDLALAAAASSSTGHTNEQAQDRLSTARPSRSGQDEAPEESSLAKQASDASSIIGAAQAPAVSDASSVGRFRTPSPGPVSSAMTAVNSRGEALAAGQSTGSAMRQDGDRVSSSKAHGFKEPPAVVRSATSGVRGTGPGSRNVLNRAPGDGEGARPIQSAESGVLSGSQQQGERTRDGGEVLERVASNVVGELRGAAAESAGEPGGAASLSPRPAHPVVRQHSSNKASLMGPPRSRPDMPPPGGSRPSGVPRPGGGFKVPQQRPPSAARAPAPGAQRPQAEAATMRAGEGGGEVAEPALKEGEQQGGAGVPVATASGADARAFEEDSVHEIAAVLVGQEMEDRQAPNQDEPGGTPFANAACAAAASPVASNVAPETGPDTAAQKTLEPALRALFPAAMYKEPAVPASKADAPRVSKAPSGQPPYEIPAWSAPPGQPYALEVVKEGAVLAQLDVSRKGAYMFGRSERADFPLEHATVSRYHAVLQFKEGGEAALFDLGSTHGTFVNKKQVKARVYVPVHVGDVLKFGQSSRLYVFQGPAELMPEEGLSRAEKQQLKRLEAAQEAKMAEESLVRARAAKLGEVTWGQADDAEDEEEQEDVEGITWETHTGPLTSNQEKSRDKVVKRRDKIANLRKEMDVIQSKEIAQGGLTPGQQAQIARNEARLEELTEELEAMEETLNESIRESLGARPARAAAGKKRGRPGSDDEDGDSDEDEFYNRAGAQKKKAARGPAPVEAAAVVETAETLLEKRDVLAGERDTLEDEIRQEEERKAALPGGKGAHDEDDALDAFMSDVSTQIERDRLAQLRRELELLDAEAARIARLLHLADPTGEAAVRWVPKKGAPGGVPRRTFKEPVKVEVAAAPEEESSAKKEEPKPRALLQAPKVALGGGGVKGAGSTGGKGATVRPREGEHRIVKDEEASRGERQPTDRGMAAGAAGPADQGEPESTANGGLVGEEGARGGASETGGSIAPEATTEGGSKGARGGAERSGEGDSRGKQRREAGPAAVAGGGTAETPLNEGAQVGGQGKGRTGKGAGAAGQKRISDVETAQGDEEQAEQPVWEPPQGQTGDGRTALNDKLGY